jgi:predicted nucleic acid-binding protein
VIAIDTSVLIDLLGDDAHAGTSEEAIRAALSQGPVVACDVVVSEVVAGLGNGSMLLDAFDESGIGYSALELRAAVRAGEMQRRYKERLRAGKVRADVPRAVPDFLIGAHALLQCTALITRDAGFFRDYFKGLKLIVPQTS